MDKPMTFIEWCSSNGKIPYSVGIEEAYEAGQQSMQAKVEELQRRNQMLNDNIKEQGQKLVYQNEVIETQAEKLLGLRDEKAELQKRVDQQGLIIAKAMSIASDLQKSWSMFEIGKKLEQALKGEDSE
ncbi:hypothetical protein [Acinetobacter baumannii]|uniref:hypothetical protein n=1 Tax=Acinetobacter baumannii TaxID=470 RepID=UPI000F65AD16|nr:hypothetical protein [Acinetobacter baumannii]RSE81394.1 hypothetical protein EGT89_11165 [Acinetobacter baumannii]RSE93829.1 hypothetical protein EGT87_12980 [Acinetobacter baumannii]RSF34193.1 hypothetical protein EGT94_10885 [Acinetobacter baumannii]RSF58026.1 hypothetical protein EGU02_11040 [Acinetobacter baumannii]